ncbi:MAG TPA: hypothetical protein DE036_08190 [Actinobacteria bacterium]|nr:hypothetical protein [Actinomycetota bacterium]
MDWDKDLAEAANGENALSRTNKAIYRQFVDCQVPAMIAAKPAYNLAQMYLQALDFNTKLVELFKVETTTDFAEKILELRESVKTLRYFSERFARGYYTLMDRLNAMTDKWYDDEGRKDVEAADDLDEILEGLQSPDLENGLDDELKAHTRRQSGQLMRKLIAKGCPEDVSNYFVDNLFELRVETTNLIAHIDRMISLDDEFEDLVLDVEEILVEISIPWIGFSPGETAHALWHIGDHDEDNFFFMGFLGWSLAVLENLQDNIDNL